MWLGAQRKRGFGVHLCLGDVVDWCDRHGLVLGSRVSSSSDAKYSAPTTKTASKSTNTTKSGAGNNNTGDACSRRISGSSSASSSIDHRSADDTSDFVGSDGLYSRDLLQAMVLPHQDSSLIDLAPFLDPIDGLLASHSSLSSSSLSSSSPASAASPASPSSLSNQLSAEPLAIDRQISCAPRVRSFVSTCDTSAELHFPSLHQQLAETVRVLARESRPPKLSSASDGVVGGAGLGSGDLVVTRHSGLNFHLAFHLVLQDRFSEVMDQGEGERVDHIVLDPGPDDECHDREGSDGESCNSHGGIGLSASPEHATANKPGLPDEVIDHVGGEKDSVWQGLIDCILLSNKCGVRSLAIPVVLHQEDMLAWATCASQRASSAQGRHKGVKPSPAAPSLPRAAVRRLKRVYGTVKAALSIIANDPQAGGVDGGQGGEGGGGERWGASAMCT